MPSGWLSLCVLFVVISVTDPLRHGQYCVNPIVVSWERSRMKGPPIGISQSKKKVMFYSNIWPLNGFLNHHTTLHLELVCQRYSKWEKFCMHRHLGSCVIRSLNSQELRRGCKGTASVVPGQQDTRRKAETRFKSFQPRAGSPHTVSQLGLRQPRSSTCRPGIPALGWGKNIQESCLDSREMVREDLASALPSILFCLREVEEAAGHKECGSRFQKCQFMT